MSNTAQATTPKEHIQKVWNDNLKKSKTYLPPNQTCRRSSLWNTWHSLQVHHPDVLL